MNIQRLNYLGVIEKAQLVGTMNKAKIFKITSVNILPFRVGNRNPQAQ